MTVAVGLLPVVAFLLALIYLDSYKLVRRRFVTAAILGGCALAIACWAVNARLSVTIEASSAQYSRYVAPLIEETAKAAAIVWLVRANRIGFLVDGAIYGFAIGTGFALVENLYYWSSLQNPSVSLWVVRGFGTAVMHGGTTAIFAIIGKTLAEVRRLPRGAGWALALLAAVALHSAFNHFFVSPAASTALVLIVLPPLIFVVFQRSETALEEWLSVGFDADTEVLENILAGTVSKSPVGEYLHELKERFRGEVVVDMLCLLRLHLELSLRAKGLLMMREAGFPVTLDAADKAKLDELDYLERSIGKTGKLAMAPFLRTSSRDLWQIYMMRDEAAPAKEAGR
jgi:RsiW-degrading membrane proteinase PrsW (M82 family)